MKKSPLQQVQEEFGSKSALAEKVVGILSADEYEAQDVFEHRVHTMSNRKLLRLWRAHQEVESRFGSKDKLVEAVVNARFVGGNDDYGRKIASFSLPRLLDLARQHGLP